MGLRLTQCSPTTVMTLPGPVPGTILSLVSMLGAPPMKTIPSVAPLMLVTSTARAIHHPYGTTLRTTWIHWDLMTTLLPPLEVSIKSTIRLENKYVSGLPLHWFMSIVYRHWNYIIIIIVWIGGILSLIISLGSCVEAGYTGCCSDLLCFGAPTFDCFCDPGCYRFGDCCHDISQTCPSPEPQGISYWLKNA